VALAVALAALSLAAAAPAASPIQVVARVEPGLLFVESRCAGGSYTGSGFLIGPRVMITARHVVEEDNRRCSSVVVRQQASGEQAAAVNWSTWYAQRRSDGRTTDLATVLLDRPLPGYNFRLTTRRPVVGQRVIALGYPFAEGLSITQGTVADLYRRGAVPGFRLHLLSDHGGSGGPIVDLSGRVLGLVQRAGGESVYSLDLAAFTGNRPTRLCAGVIKGASSTVCGTARPGLSGRSSNVYRGRTFSIRYPLGWRIRDAETDKGTYVDTTIIDPRNPSWLLRIDFGGNPVSSPRASAAPVIAALRRDPSYRELSLRDVRFLDYPAVRWEFTVREKGTLLHKVDIFFIDSKRRDWAVLFQSPAADWSNSDPRFAAAVASLRLN
jgi:Trypsin-like peptidase domain